MIFVVEGADGTGKTTLVERLVAHFGAEMFHCGYHRDMDIERMHEAVADLAAVHSQAGVHFVLDRWAVSEEVYATVFRDGPSYNTRRLIDLFKDQIVWIYCRNDNAVENHLRNKEVREELYGDMTRVVELYDVYVATSGLDWHVFDYDHDITEDFIDSLVG